MSFGSEIRSDVQPFSSTPYPQPQTAVGPAPVTTLFHSTLEGTALVKDKGAEQNQIKSIHRLQKAVDRSDFDRLVRSDHLLKVGLYYREYAQKIDPQAFKKAFVFFSQGAQLGEINCIKYLAYMYFNGEGTTLNLRKALHFFHIGAEKGDKNCLRYLGEMYGRGLGVKLDERKSLYYLQQVNTPEAWKVLSSYYKNGIGCETNLELADQFIKKIEEHQFIKE